MSKASYSARAHRHRVPRWSTIHLGVITVFGICLAILVFILEKQPRTAVHQQPEIRPVQETSYTPGLTVAEATLDHKSRTIKGVVENRTEKTMDDVEVSYDLRDDQYASTDRPVVRIGSLKPYQSARFETGKLSPTGFQWSLLSLTGRSR